MIQRPYLSAAIGHVPLQVVTNNQTTAQLGAIADDEGNLAELEAAPSPPDSPAPLRRSGSVLDGLPRRVPERSTDPVFTQARVRAEDEHQQNLLKRSRVDAVLDRLLGGEGIEEYTAAVLPDAVDKRVPVWARAPEASRETPEKSAWWPRRLPAKHDASTQTPGPADQCLRFRWTNNRLEIRPLSAFEENDRDIGLEIFMHGSGVQVRDNGAWVENPGEDFFRKLDQAWRAGAGSSLL